MPATHTYSKAFHGLGHDCELPAEEDDLQTASPEDNFCARLRRYWLTAILVNEKICKASSLHLRSHGSIQQERLRHLSQFTSIIHPYSTFRIFWKMTMVIVFFVLVTVVSLDLAYFSFEGTTPFLSSMGFRWFRTFLDLICCVDVVVNSFTGYYDEFEKQVVLKHRSVVIHYLKTTFFMDFISSIPTHLELLITFPKNWIKDGVLLEPPHQETKHDQLMAMIQLLAIFKFFKLYRIVQYIKRIACIFNIGFRSRQLLIMFVLVSQYWHGMSCLRVYFYVLFIDERNIVGYTNRSKFLYAYARSVYDSSLIIYTSTYGVLQPETSMDYMTTNVLWLVSKYVQICILAMVVGLLRVKNCPRIKNAEMIKQVAEFMRHKQLPLYTQQRILSYYDFHYQQSYFREAEIFKTISGQLRQEIIMQTCKQLVENVTFFRELPLNLLVRIVTCLKSEIYMTNDVIVRSECPGECMYFIHTGTVAVYTGAGKEICHLKDGAHFGEIALVSVQAERVASVVAVEICELYRLDRKDFIKAIQPYPDLLEKITKIAMERLEMTEMIVKQRIKQTYEPERLDRERRQSFQSGRTSRASFQT